MQEDKPLQIGDYVSICNYRLGDLGKVDCGIVARIDNALVPQRIMVVGSNNGLLALLPSQPQSLKKIEVSGEKKALIDAAKETFDTISEGIR